MVELLLKMLRPSGVADYALYACMTIPIIAGCIFSFLAISQRQKSRLLEQVMNRYDLVHRALDDFMILATASIPLVVTSVVEATERVASLGLSATNYTNEVQMAVNKLKKVSEQIISDNPNSAVRSSTKEQILYGKKPNPLRSPLVWAIFIPTVGIAAFFNYVSSQHVRLVVQLPLLILSYICLAAGYRHFGQARSLRRTTEGEASLKVYLFNIRRDFIAETGNKLQDLHVGLTNEGQQLSRVPQAREYFNGLVSLAKISKGILAVHHGSDMSSPAPLLSVSAAVQKQAEKAYQPVAKEHHIGLLTAVDSGLAFRIDPKDFERVTNILVENAITYSKPGARIVIRGKRRGDRILISVTDTGSGIDKQTLDFLFRPRPVQTNGTYKPERVSLGLQVCKVILTRIGAELRVSTKPGKGTSATIVAPRRFTDISLDIPQHIGARSSQLN